MATITPYNQTINTGLYGNTTGLTDPAHQSTYNPLMTNTQSNFGLQMPVGTNSTQVPSGLVNVSTGQPVMATVPNPTIAPVVQPIIQKPVLSPLPQSRPGSVASLPGATPTIVSGATNLTSNPNDPTGAFGPNQPAPVSNTFTTSTGTYRKETRTDANGNPYTVNIQVSGPTGTTSTTPTTVDSGLYTGPVNPDQAQIDAANAILQNTSQETDPNKIYATNMAQYQAQIDALNNVYNDQLAAARTQGQGRLGSQTAMQARGGLLGSDFGKAMTDTQTAANNQEQQAIDNQRNAAIQDVYAKVRTGALAEAQANTLAKTQGANAILENVKNRQSTRDTRTKEAVAGLVARGVNIDTMTPEQIKSFTDGLSLTDRQFKDAMIEATKASEASKTTAKAAADKAALEATKTTAETAKINADVANWGKMTDYQKAQIAIDKYKAYNPTGTASQQKANAMGQIASELNPTTEIIGKDTMGNPKPTGKYVMDKNGYITPEGYKYMVQNAPQLGLSKEEVLKQFGQLIYNDPKKGIPDTYGLTPADKKIITGVIA